MTTSNGVDYIRGVDNDLKILKKEVDGLREVASRLRADIALESQLRGGEISSLQHKTASDLKAEIGEVRKEVTERFTEFETTLKKWAASFCHEIMNIKPRIDTAEMENYSRKAEIAKVMERCGVLEGENPKIRSEIAALCEKCNNKFADVTTQAIADREVSASAVRAAQAIAATDFCKASERIDALSHSLECNKKILTADISAVASKVDAVESFAYTRAKAADLQALELRVNETIEKSLKDVSEELDRKEYSTTVKALSDKVHLQGMEIQIVDASTKTVEEALTKQIASVSQDLQKAVRQVDMDRERANECYVQLEREVSNRSLKIEMDAAVVRIGSIEIAVQPLAPAIAMKADAQEIKGLASRTLALEQVYPTKADASELPKLQLLIADCSAKHSQILNQMQEQQTRLEKIDDGLDEQLKKIAVVEIKSKETANTLSTKADVDTVYSREALVLLFKDYYSRTEVDAMLTRVWWRMGDATKTARLPSPWSAGSN